MLNIEPIQEGSGDPSPDNVRPISGRTGASVWRTGKNLFNPDSSDNEWVDVNSNITHPPSAKSMRVPVSEGNIITLSNETPSSGTNVLLIAFVDRNNTILSRTVVSNGSLSITKRAPQGATWAIASFYRWAEVENAQLELGATATPYEPYSGVTIPVSWETEAGTVYAGELDVISGVLTVYSVLWEKNTAEMNNSIDYPGWKNSGVEQLIGRGINRLFTNQIMNIGSSFNANTVSTADVLFLSKTSYGLNQDEWIALALDVQIIIPLATPQTYQLTPQQILALFGTNVVWSDAANSIEMQYTGYIDD